VADPPPLGEWPEQWRTPLASAVVLGKADAVRGLLELGAEIDVSEPGGRTLHQIAAESGNGEIVKLLDAFSVEPSEARTDLVARFLAAACPDHHVRGKPAHLVALHTAERLLGKHPELARDSIYTAVVCEDIEHVGRLLAARPELAREKGGPNGSAGGRGSTFTVQSRTASHPKWEPILYLCFTRLENPASNDHALAIATMLLDHGADPNAYFMAGDSRYSPLTGVVGLGEEDRPPHPRRDELARLLLERGAEPYDIQVFYDVHFSGDVLWYLKLIYEQTHRNGRSDDWKDPQWSMIDMGGYGLGAHYLLRIAVSNNNLELAEWILAHGADPNAPGPSRVQRGGRKELASFHEMALRQGYAEMADLLVRFGAKTSGYAPDGEDRFVDAVLRLNRVAATRIGAEHPEYLRSPKAMFAATSRDNAEAVRLLIELGVSIEMEDNDKQRPLHIAASNDAISVARLLIERGAEIDPVETNWGNSPIDFARYFQLTRLIDLLAPYSRDLWTLAFAGKVDRLRELLTADPRLAMWVLPNGVTPLMRLPDDEAKAREIVELFLANGADASRRNEEGLSAADIAEQRGMDEIAALLKR
jgi:ankyrin repeat protein